MRRVFFLIAVLAVGGLMGCASTGTQARDSQVQQLQGQVSRLQNELQQKNDKIDYLESRLYEVESKKTTVERTAVKDEGPMTRREIQTALKNAGFYNGTIDGKIGPMTEKAIKEFQRANNLTDDGIVGRQTRLQLRMYLE